jgi:protein TonB
VPPPQPAAAAAARVAASNAVVPPRLLGDISGTCPGIYPPAAQRRRVQGRVIVRTRISADGLPGEVAVATSSGSDQLDRAAVAAARDCRRYPRAAAPYEAEIPYNFMLSN